MKTSKIIEQLSKNLAEFTNEEKPIEQVVKDLIDGYKKGLDAYIFNINVMMDYEDIKKNKKH